MEEDVMEGILWFENVVRFVFGWFWMVVLSVCNMVKGFVSILVDLIFLKFFIDEFSGINIEIFIMLM